MIVHVADVIVMKEKAMVIMVKVIMVGIMIKAAVVMITSNIVEVELEAVMEEEETTVIVAVALVLESAASETDHLTSSAQMYVVDEASKLHE